jgi:hypothetical protein
MTFPVLLCESILPLPAGATSGDARPVALAFSADGTKLAIGWQDGVRLMDVYGNRQAWRTDVGRNVSAVAFSRDGSLLFALTEDKPELRALNIASGETAWSANLAEGANLRNARLVAGAGKSVQLHLPPGGKGRNGFLVIEYVDGKETAGVPGPLRKGSGVLALAGNGSRLAILKREPSETEANAQAVRLEVFAEETGDPVFAKPIPGAAAMAAEDAGRMSLSMSACGTSVAVAGAGLDPVVADVDAPDAEPYVLKTGSGVVNAAMSACPELAVFLGKIPGKGEAVSAGGPETHLVAVNPDNGSRWILEGEFLQGSLQASGDGRWIAVLTRALPARAARGRGLLLLDNSARGGGEQKIVYTYSTSTPPPGPLVMAGDGSAIAFVEFKARHDESGSPALVVNVIR